MRLPYCTCEETRPVADRCTVDVARCQSRASVFVNGRQTGERDAVRICRVGQDDFMLPRWLTTSDAVVFAAARLAWDCPLDPDAMHTEIRGQTMWIVNDAEPPRG